MKERGHVVGAFVVAFAMALVAWSCGGKSQTPSSPSSAAPSASVQITGPHLTGSGGPAGGWAPSIDFPPRDQPFDFRNRLEGVYRDTLRRSPVSTFVDIEGDIVWITEYIRYRVNLCDHQTATANVRSVILTGVTPPVCGTPPSGQVPFPPRDQPFAFRNDLEAIYRDTLRRSAVSTFVDIEGDIVWITEYLRYRLNGCDHQVASDNTIREIVEGVSPPVCSGGPPPSPGGGASLGFTFTPNPVPPSPNPCGGQSPAWDFDVSINETAGVAFTVSGFTVDFFDGSGVFLGNQQGSGGDFANLFDACGAGSARINANGQTCARVCVHLGGRSGGFTELTIRGADERGNQLTFASGRLRLAAAGLSLTADRAAFGPPRLLGKH